MKEIGRSRSFYVAGLTRVSAPLPTLSHPRALPPRVKRPLEDIFKSHEGLKNSVARGRESDRFCVCLLHKINISVLIKIRIKFELTLRDLNFASAENSKISILPYSRKIGE